MKNKVVLDFEFLGNYQPTRFCVVFRETIKGLVEEIKTEEQLAEPGQPERNGVTQEMRRDRANSLRRDLALKQAKFLQNSGDVEV